MATGDGGTVLSDAATESDELGRGRYVRSLTRLVLGAETPLVIAIYGAWGSGKTSMMLQVRRALDPRYDVAAEVRRGEPEPPVRTVWFEPWMHQFDDAPALGLLHAVVDQLGVAQRPRVRDALAKIAIAFAEDVKVPVVGVRFGKLRDVRDELRAREFEQREERTRLRQHFRAALEAAGAGPQRIVVFIDDLDRCRPEQSVRLLESLKLYLDVPGCVFILGVDREPLEAAVATSYRELGLRTESYLDKIIQLPFSIPAIDEMEMLDFITARLPDGLDGCQELLAAAAADEPRSVKRLTNALLVNHQLALESVFPQPYDVGSLAALVLIQNLAPDLYRQVRLDPQLFGEVFLHRDAPPPVLPDDDPGAQTDMWRTYIEPRPRLEKALRLYAHDPGRDVRPYLTLTGLAVTEPTVSSSPRQATGSIILVDGQRAGAGWSGRIGRALEGVGWRVERAGPTEGQRAPSKQSPTWVDAVVLVVGPGGDVPAGVVETIALARQMGRPIVPVAVGDADLGTVIARLPSKLAFLAELPFVHISDESFDRDVAGLERELETLRGK